MVDTCLVTGAIVAPDGTPVRRTFMLFQRLPEEAFVADDATGLPTPVTKRTEDDGSIEVELIPGAYLVKQWYSRHDYFRIDVPDEPTARLEDIQDDILQPPPSRIIEAVEAAEEAAQAAEAARNSAYNLYGDLQAIDTALNQSLALYGGLSEVQDAVTDAEGSAAAAAASLQAAQEITGGAYGIGTRPMELPRNTELASGAFAPYEPMSLAPVVLTAAYTATPDDTGKMLLSGGYDVTLPDSNAPGMGSGWRVWVKNTDGAASLTVACTGGDALDGGGGIALAAGDAVLIVRIASGQYVSL